ncbi:hypothetical protein P4S72_04490 [Vibrio sp. PP-XX7]
MSKVQDKRLLALIGKYLRAGVMINDQFEASFEGVPQGGPLSPLLSNIMLDSLDKELESRGHPSATRMTLSSWSSLNERANVSSRVLLAILPLS